MTDEEEANTGERPAWAQVLEAADPAVRHLALRAQERIAATLPDAVEEVDRAARMLGFTYQPGTYKGLVTAVVVHKSHINIMFGNGVELREQDVTGLLEGRGKRARHIRSAPWPNSTTPTSGNCWSRPQLSHRGRRAISARVQCR